MICPYCQKDNPKGSMFCLYCVMPLNTSSNSNNSISILPNNTKSKVQLILIENLQPTGESITLPSPPYENPIIIGRNDLFKSIVVDIDLTKMDGQNKRVSRKHASIDYDKDHYTIEDLNSTHGTFINKAKIEDNNPHTIKNGDEIRLANMTFKILMS